MNKPKKLPDLDYLLAEYIYDPLTGKLHKKDWDDEKGKEVGWKDKRGYHHVRIKKQVYKLHRIVFYMYHRRDPGKKVIDHIDGDASNNQIFNLRAVAHKVNLQNTSKARATKPRPKSEPNAWRALAVKL